MARPIVITDAATFDPQTGYYHLRDVHFADVEISGPAVIAVGGSISVNGCSFSGPFDLTFRLAAPDETVPVGAIIAEDLVFERCALRGISFLGNERFISAVGVDLLR